MIVMAARAKGWRCLNAPAPQQEKTHRMIGFVIPNEELPISTDVEDIIKKLLPTDTILPDLFVRWLRGEVKIT